MNKAIYIPPECAHGFLTLKKNTVILYKTSKYYNKNSEIVYNIFDKKY